MTKLKLCNVHKLTLANEGEERNPIHIPFGTWAYDDTLDQTLDREHAEKIANELKEMVDKGEPGIPVYQGHPDVPEYAGKYPDKGALGWVKTITVNEDGMDLDVEWDRDPGKGFGWFSPYWVGDTPAVGPNGKRNCIIDGLNSIGLVNNPNIREFRLANEAGENLTQRRGGAEVAPFEMPAHLLALAKRFDDRVALANVIDANGMGHSDENGQFDGSGSGGGASGGSSYEKKLVATRQAAVDAAQKTFDEAKSALIAGQKRGWSKQENDKAFKAYDKAERKLKFAKSELRTAIGAPSISHEEQVRRDAKSVFRGTATKAARDRYMSELAAHFDERLALANVIDANGMGHSDENGQFDGSGSGGGGGGGKVDVGQAKEKLGLMLKREAVSVAAGGKPGQGDIEFEHRGKRYYVGKDSEHMVKQFEDAGLVKRVSSGASVADKFKAAASKAAKDPAAMKFNDALKAARKAKDGAGIARAHMQALKAGMVWDKSIKGYRPPVAK